mmetsp:Transcript_1760/g.6220  ORF Transcript_1760/g.6220 Transcript_1760/m.6220 type:complete len:161 (+) Transcript_1760:1004-1486(+)
MLPAVQKTIRCCGTHPEVGQLFVDKYGRPTNISLLEYVRAAGTDNIQLRMVTGIGWLQQADGWFAREELPDIDKLIDLGKRYLRRYSFVAVLEDWSRTVDLFYATLGIRQEHSWATGCVLKRAAKSNRQCCNQVASTRQGQTTTFTIAWQPTAKAATVLP